MKKLLVLLLLLNCMAWGDVLTEQIQERTAIERIYYNHRLGEKRPFEQVSPPALIERLVRKDLHKEAVLQHVYGVEITRPMLEVEVQRINSSTRAPEMLAEIKAALDNDRDKFAQAYAKRFLVERLLREKFENDDSIHAPVRQNCESIRSELLACRSNGDSVDEMLERLRQGDSRAVTEIRWELGARPRETDAGSGDEMEIRKRFGPDAQILSTPKGGAMDQKFYFEDLPPELQKILRVQLQQPGDVSAVIEVSGGFLLYVCRERTDEALGIACFSNPKHNYDQWLNEQSGGAP